MARIGAVLVASLLLLGPSGSAGAVDSPGELAYAFGDDIWVANADGSAVRRLTNAGATPAWSPDGSTLAFVSFRDDPARARSGLYVMKSDGSGVRRITDGGVARFLEAPVWSPDGTQIAIVGMRASGEGSDVLLVSADGRGARWLTNTPLAERDVQWSALDRVLFAAFDGIFEAATSGGPPRALVAGAWAPALSPERSRLAYVAWRGALRALHVADASGRNPRVFLLGERTRGRSARVVSGRRAYRVHGPVLTRLQPLRRGLRRPPVARRARIRRASQAHRRSR